MSFFLAKAGAAGTLFGAALAASGVYSPSIIIAQMQLKDFHMLKVFLGASASSALIIVLFEQLGLSKCSPRTPSSLGWVNKYDGNILGGILIGTGMALTGACPGTSLVQLAAGVRSGAFVVLGGMIAGVLYTKTSKYFRRSSCPNTASPNEVHTVYEKLDVSRSTTVTIYEMTCILVVTMAMHFTAPRRDTLPSALGGLLIGGAQAGSLLLTGNLVGVSAAYHEFGNFCWHAIESVQNVDSKSRTQVAYKSIVFAAGIMAGSWAILTCIPSLLITGHVQVSSFRALAGGFSMVFGARIAGGCTSGHGISGMSMLSISSFITVASMFGGGMGLAAILSHK